MANVASTQHVIAAPTVFLAAILFFLYKTSAQEPFLSATALTSTTTHALLNGTSVPPVFSNGAWDPDGSGTLNAYVASLLSKDVYYKHMVDPRNAAAVRRNFTLFTTLFCQSMTRLGADECEAIPGAGSLVWAVVRAGRSVLLVFRGSNNPENWIADVTSFRTTNVADFGGGDAGTNVALGFYKIFTVNRHSILDRVTAAVGRASAAALAAAGASPSGADPAAAGADGGEAGESGQGGGGARLWVFGHSLGGAVALMTAAYLDRQSLTPTGVYTFGCPRVGDVSWARAYRLHDVTLRLENTGDIVPTLPFGAAWRHVGSSSTIQRCGGDGAETTTSVSSAMTSSEDAEVLRSIALAAAAVGGASGAAGGADAGEAGVRDSAATGALAVVRRLRRLRGAAMSVASSGREGEGEYEGGGARTSGNMADASEALPGPALVGLMPDGTPVSFPFPISIQDHWIESYVRVMWSCLPSSDQDLVPGPEDIYAA